MSFLIIIILGIIQGACEFLPVSSSGHLVVFYNLFGIYENTILLSIILHVATLLAVVIVYNKQLLLLIKKPFCKTNLLLLCATIPTVLMVLIFEKFIEKSFSGEFVIICFLITAILLFISEKINKKATKFQKDTINNTNNNIFLTKTNIYDMNINYFQALFIGVMQGVATLPGISRSGATISAGLMAGVNKNEVADFSFLLSIPIILASLIYELLKLNNQAGVIGFSFSQLVVGFLVTFFVGLLCLKAMIKLVKKQKLYIFSIYLVLLCVFLLINKYVVFWF